MEEDRIKRLEERFEEIIKANKCDDREIQDALLSVARNHIWKEGFLSRIKFWANMIGAVGVIAGLLTFMIHFFGWEFTRR